MYTVQYHEILVPCLNKSEKPFGRQRADSDHGRCPGPYSVIQSARGLMTLSLADFLFILPVLIIF